MGILSKITGNKDEQEAPVQDAVCPHTALTTKWRNPEDLGKAELATYTCESCGETLNYDQAKAILDPSKHTPNLPIG
jgi:hypothetical protein